MQPADHGTEGIEAANGSFIERGHQVDLFSLSLQPVAFLYKFTGETPHFILSFRAEGLEPLRQVEIFCHRIMKKVTRTTIAVTTRTGAAIVRCYLVVSLVHGLVDN